MRELKQIRESSDLEIQKLNTTRYQQRRNFYLTKTGDGKHACLQDVEATFDKYVAIRAAELTKMQGLCDLLRVLKIRRSNNKFSAALAFGGAPSDHLFGIEKA